MVNIEGFIARAILRKSQATKIKTSQKITHMRSTLATIHRGLNTEVTAPTRPVIRPTAINKHIPSHNSSNASFIKE